jgi:hypothetical protein
MQPGDRGHPFPELSTLPSRQVRPRDPAMAGLPRASLLRPAQAWMSWCAASLAASGPGSHLACLCGGLFRPTWDSGPADVAKGVSHGQDGLPAATSVGHGEGQEFRPSRAAHAARARRERVANLLREGQSLCVGDTVRGPCQPVPRRPGQACVPSRDAPNRLADTLGSVGAEVAWPWAVTDRSAPCDRGSPPAHS